MTYMISDHLLGLGALGSETSSNDDNVVLLPLVVPLGLQLEAKIYKQSRQSHAIFGKDKPVR